MRAFIDRSMTQLASYYNTIYRYSHWKANKSLSPIKWSGHDYVSEKEIILKSTPAFSLDRSDQNRNRELCKRATTPDASALIHFIDDLCVRRRRWILCQFPLFVSQRLTQSGYFLRLDPPKSASIGWSPSDKRQLRKKPQTRYKSSSWVYFTAFFLASKEHGWWTADWTRWRGVNQHGLRYGHIIVGSFGTHHFVSKFYS